MLRFTLLAIALLLPAAAIANPADKPTGKPVPDAETELAARIALGKSLDVNLGCVACHMVKAPNGRGTVGPQYSGLYGSTRKTADGRTVKIDADYLRRAILTPMADLAQGFPPSMPPYQGQLDDAQVEALVAHVASHGVDGAPPINAPKPAPKPPAEAPKTPPTPKTP